MSGTADILNLNMLEEYTGLTLTQAREQYIDKLETLYSPRHGLKLDELLRYAASAAGVDAQGVIEGLRGEPYLRAKQFFVAWARRDGHTQADIARALDCSEAGVSKMVKKGR